MLLFPIPLARNKDPETIHIGCAACTMILVYNLSGCKEKIAVDEDIFCSTVQDELTRIKFFFLKMRTPCLIFLFPFVIINVEF